jgi:hypothetical protein
VLSSPALGSVSPGFDGAAYPDETVQNPGYLKPRDETVCVRSASWASIALGADNLQPVIATGTGEVSVRSDSRARMRLTPGRAERKRNVVQR